MSFFRGLGERFRRTPQAETNTFLDENKIFPDSLTRILDTLNRLLAESDDTETDNLALHKHIDQNIRDIEELNSPD